MDIKVSYNNTSIVTQQVAVNYERRYPENFEKISDNIKNDPLLSLENKGFYLKLDGDTQLSSMKVQFNGINNLWLNTTTQVLKF